MSKTQLRKWTSSIKTFMHRRRGAWRTLTFGITTTSWWKVGGGDTWTIIERRKWRCSSAKRLCLFLIMVRDDISWVLLLEWKLLACVGGSNYPESLIGCPPSFCVHLFSGGEPYLVLTVSQPVSLWNNVFTENLLFSSLFCLGISESNKVFLQDIFLFFLRKQSQKCYWLKL